MEHDGYHTSALVAIDFSPVSSRVCRTAVDWAKAFGAQLWLVHVASPDPDFVGYEAGPDVVREQRSETLRDEHRKLQDLASGMEKRGVEVTPILAQGPTVATILEQADRHDADIIIMATHGHNMVYQVLVGSVSEGVIRGSDRPVLLVPARGATGS